MEGDKMARIYSETQKQKLKEANKRWRAKRTPKQIEASRAYNREYQRKYVKRKREDAEAKAKTTTGAEAAAERKRTPPARQKPAMGGKTVYHMNDDKLTPIAAAFVKCGFAVPEQLIIAAKDHARHMEVVELMRAYQAFKDLYGRAY